MNMVVHDEVSAANKKLWEKEVEKGSMWRQK